MNVLICGLGSIAQKHITVLKDLYPNVNVYAIRSSLQSKKQMGVIDLYSFSNLEKYSFEFVLISSPSSIHLEHIRELSKYDIPLMIEKPLFTSLVQIQEYNTFVKKPIISYLACNMRFHPCIVFLKKYLEDNPDKINEVQSYCGSYLPNWRPQIDYRTNYSAIKELGGGVHLDLIHEPDYLRYLLGLPNKVTSYHYKNSNLEIDTYDSSTYFMNYDLYQVVVKLNYFRRDTKRTLEIVRENDTLFIDFINCEIKNLVTDTVLFSDPNIDPLLTYREQMKYFLECIDQGKELMNSIQDSISLLKSIL